MNFNSKQINSSIIEKAYSKTPYVAYNLESLKYPSIDTSKTYIALSNLNNENNYIEILIYDYIENEFEIGYFYQHVFSPIGGISWMPRKNVRLEDNILATGSDSIKLFKEGKLICDLRLNDLELDNMRIGNVYNSSFTKITSFSFSQYNPTDIISTTIDGRCILWNIDYYSHTKILEMNIFQDIINKYKNKLILNISQINGYSLMDVCFGHLKDNILLAFNNGLALSLDLRAPFKQSSSIVIDCINGWNVIPDKNYVNIKLCNIQDTNYFSRSILSQNITEIFDIRKLCAPLFKINTNENDNYILNKNDNQFFNSIISVQNHNSSELLITNQNGKINKFKLKEDNIDNIISYNINHYTHSFTTLNINYKNKNNSLAIASINTQDQPGIKVIEFKK